MVDVGAEDAVAEERAEDEDVGGVHGVVEGAARVEDEELVGGADAEDGGEDGEVGVVEGVVQAERDEEEGGGEERDAGGEGAAGGAGARGVDAGLVDELEERVGGEVREEDDVGGDDDVVEVAAHAEAPEHERERERGGDALAERDGRAGVLEGGDDVLRDARDEVDGDEAEDDEERGVGGVGAPVHAEAAGARHEEEVGVVVEEVAEREVVGGVVDGLAAAGVRARARATADAVGAARGDGAEVGVGEGVGVLGVGDDDVLRGHEEHAGGRLGAERAGVGGERAVEGAPGVGGERAERVDGAELEAARREAHEVGGGAERVELAARPRERAREVAEADVREGVVLDREDGRRAGGAVLYSCGRGARGGGRDSAGWGT